MKNFIRLILLLGVSSISVIVNAQMSVTDYSNNDSWSVICTSPQKQIDVFFVHPTTYEGPANGRYTADLSDTAINNFTDKTAINRYIRLFDDNCNVYAPRYQQVNIEVLSMNKTDKARYIEIPKKDIKAALIYYLKNYNNGRPFILAAHSQGSNLIHDILLENPDIINKEQLVAAYLPGWTFTQEDIDNIGINISSSPEETGCLMVWNTIGQNGSSPTLTNGALCVNPLSWNSKLTNQPKSKNKGAFILTISGTEAEIDNFTSAMITESGGLQIPKPDTIYDQLDMSMGPNCYHRYDYDFFFNNVKENVGTRCNAFLDKQSK